MCMCLVWRRPPFIITPCMRREDETLAKLSSFTSGLSSKRRGQDKKKEKEEEKEQAEAEAYHGQVCVGGVERGAVERRTGWGLPPAFWRCGPAAPSPPCLSAPSPPPPPCALLPTQHIYPPPPSPCQNQVTEKSDILDGGDADEDDADWFVGGLRFKKHVDDAFRADDYVTIPGGGGGHKGRGKGKEGGRW